MDFNKLQPFLNFLNYLHVKYRMSFSMTLSAINTSITATVQYKVEMEK